MVVLLGGTEGSGWVSGLYGKRLAKSCVHSCSHMYLFLVLSPSKDIPGSAVGCVFLVDKTVQHIPQPAPEERLDE